MFDDATMDKELTRAVDTLDELDGQIDEKSEEFLSALMRQIQNEGFDSLTIVELDYLAFIFWLRVSAIEWSMIGDGMYESGLTGNISEEDYKDFAHWFSIPANKLEGKVTDRSTKYFVRRNTSLRLDDTAKEQLRQECCEYTKEIIQLYKAGKKFLHKKGFSDDDLYVRYIGG